MSSLHQEWEELKEVAMRRMKASLCVIALTLASAVLVFPQGADNGAIQGTVTDKSGAVVP